jgi:dihydrofolate reductase
MAKLSVYNFVSANGYFKGPDDDIAWAHQNPSEDENQFASENAQGGAILLFGRKTYEMMASFWPTPQGVKANAGVSKGMTSAEKIVFSKTLKQANWANTRIVNNSLEDEVKKLKQGTKSITVLGSGSIVNQLASKGLIDEFQIMVHPVAIGHGTAFLSDISRKIELELINTRSFKSGIVLLYYKPKN